MSSSTPCPSRMIRSCRRREMTSFWDRPSSTTGMRTGPRAGWSSGFLRRGSTCPSPHRGRARDEEKTREGERKGVVNGMSKKKLTRIDRADSATTAKISPSPPPPPPTTKRESDSTGTTRRASETTCVLLRRRRRPHHRRRRRRAVVVGSDG